MPCHFLEDGRCKLAELVAKRKFKLTIECRPDEQLCQRCLPESPSLQHAPEACLELANPPKKSRGLGDTVAKVTKATGLDKAAKAIAQAFGKADCGCRRRQEKLNKLVPYRSGK